MPQSLRDSDGFYHIDGHKMASVTMIIHEMLPRDALNVWKERTPNWPEIMRKARIYGVLMHMQLQGMISDFPPEVPGDLPYQEWPEDTAEELEGRMRQWERLGLDVGRPNMVEHTIHSREYPWFAGTMDHRGPVDGLKAIMDFKSSSRPQEGHKYQIGAYYLGSLAEGYDAEIGIIPYIRRDSAELVELSREEMKEYGKEFIELAAQFYR